MRRTAKAVTLAIVVVCGAVATPACSSGGETKAQPVHGPADVPVPDTPAHAAASLARIERALRSPSTTPGDVDRLGWEQQNAYRALAAHPGWLRRLRARLPADVQPIVAANERAGRDLQHLGGHAGKPRHLPSWHIVKPLPAEVLRSYYGEAEAASGVPWAYLASIHLVETRLGRIRGTSTAGARGPMQFLPATWQRYGQGDINDNHDAILGAARLLQANGAPDDMAHALFHYNNSKLYVDAVESYARLMLSDERAFLGYYAWQVYYATTHGTYLLPEGYPRKAARRVSA